MSCKEASETGNRLHAQDSARKQEEKVKRGEKELNEKLHVSSSPHIRDKVKSSNIMLMVIIGLLPATLFGIWNFRHENAWILVVVTTAAAVLSEYIWEKLMHKTNHDQGLQRSRNRTSACSEPSANTSMVDGVVGAVFAIIVVKQLFGGLGQNFMNPALAARCFLLILLYRKNDLFCL